MNNKEIMKRLQECVDSEAKTIDGCTKLTEFERYAWKSWTIHGINQAALYLLSTDEYLKVRSWSREKHGIK